MADASEFIRMKKYQAINARAGTDSSTKSLSHLYQPVPSVRDINTFLPSLTNKNLVANKPYIPLGVLTGPQAKNRVPGGQVNG